MGHRADVLQAFVRWERGDDRDDFRIPDDPAALRAFRAAVDR